MVTIDELTHEVKNLSKKITDFEIQIQKLKQDNEIQINNN